MSFDHGLEPGTIITNKELMEIFKCAVSGGMRRSRKTNSLVLISDHTKSIYEDRWINDIFHYTGMGLEGNQSLNYAQNKTLAESETNDVNIFLFEVFEPKKYTYIGEVKLASESYQEKQADINDNLRLVWVFPLKLKEEQSQKILPENLIKKKQQQKAQEARNLSNDELEKRAQYSKKGIGVRSVQTTSYERNEYVAEYAKRRANGICELCEHPAPFKNSKGFPFLETHHIIWLSEEGPDTIDNTVALCPNCHRKMHVLNLDTDNEKLKEKIKG